MQYFDILLFAVIAGVLLVRLRGVLGRRTGNESPPPGPAPTTSRAAERDVIGQMSEETQEEEDDPIRRGLMNIARADSSFDSESFLGGASKAFEMVVTAFSAGDRKAIAPLLSPEVRESFEAAISARESEGHVRETKIVHMEPMEIEAAYLEGSRASITVRFETEKVDVTHDAEGNVIEGDPEIPERATDVWTFERDTTGDNPNWLLVRTGD